MVGSASRASGGVPFTGAQVNELDRSRHATSNGGFTWVDRVFLPEDDSPKKTRSMCNRQECHLGGLAIVSLSAVSCSTSGAANAGSQILAGDDLKPFQDLVRKRNACWDVFLRIYLLLNAINSDDAHDSLVVQ